MVTVDVTLLGPNYRRWAASRVSAAPSIHTTFHHVRCVQVHVPLFLGNLCEHGFSRSERTYNGVFSHQEARQTILPSCSPTTLNMEYPVPSYQGQLVCFGEPLPLSRKLSPWRCLRKSIVMGFTNRSNSICILSCGNRCSRNTSVIPQSVGACSAFYPQRWQNS